MKTKVLSTMAVFAIVIGAAGAAFAGDGLSPGSYEVDVPGIGTVVLTVADGVVEVTTVPDGYTVELDSDDDDSEFLILDAAGNTALKIEFEGDELEIKGATATPGTHVFTLPDIGTVTVEVAADGSISVVAPGFTVVSDDHGQVTLVSEDGMIEMQIEIEDGVIQLQVEADDESDAVIDDESDDDHSDDVLSDDSDDDHESDDDHDRDKGHDSDDDDDSHDESHDD